MKTGNSKAALLATCLGCIGTLTALAQLSFTAIPAGLTQENYGAATWADYNNDGNPDLLVTGSLANDGHHLTQLYRNNGDGTFTPVSTGMEHLNRSAAAWGDLDNDGDLDVVIAGTTDPGGIPTTVIYRNNRDGTFTDLKAGLPGLQYASFAWGDYDRDGRLDLALTGKNPAGSYLTAIYRNRGDGTFADTEATLPGVQLASVAWGDYDNDGFPDLVLSGQVSGGSVISRIYRNNRDGTFSDIHANLPGRYYAAAAWGDYDNDGHLDLALTGADAGNHVFSSIYRNNGDATFTSKSSGLPNVAVSAVAWGDADNDGRLDLLIAGTTSAATGAATAQIYGNNGDGTFSRLASLPGVSSASGGWADYDRDGALDVVLTGSTILFGGSPRTVIYRSAGASSNTPPTVPEGLAVAIATNAVVLSWQAASDAQTPSAGLTYNVRVGTTPGSSDIVSPAADPSGRLRLAALGNAQLRRSLPLYGLVPGKTYYWSVQAIDTGFAGSPFAPEASFTLVPPPADIADDFNDSSGASWTRYDALAGAFTNYVAASFAVTNGQYRVSIPKPTPNPYGYVRAIPHRADQTYADFEVSADIAAWDNAGGSWFGVLGRLNRIGLNQTAGYMLWYRSDAKALFLNVVRGEAGYSITPNVPLTLDPTHQYRFTLTGIGERLTGTVVDLAAPNVVMASMTALSGLFPSGHCGLFAGGLGGTDVTYDRFVARTPSPAPPALKLSAAPTVAFQTSGRYPTGLFPHGIDKGDLNRDGVLDLVIANNRASSVGVFLGQTNGSFTKQADYPVGAGPLSPTVATLNADAFPDVVVANGSSTNVSVLLGQAHGTLGAKTDFTVGSRPASIALGDFNRDGRLDLATANSGSTNVSVLLGNGDGTFKAKTDFTVGKTPLVVRTADLNGDGFMDLVTANNGENTIAVLLGRGDGTFQDKASYPVQAGPSSVALADFDADGHLDVAVANRSGHSVMVLPGQAHGTLGPAISTTFVNSPWDLVVADLDGDGRADLVVTTTVVGQVALLMGQGDGSFSRGSALLDVGDNCTSAIVADFNQDQRPDLAVLCQFGDRLEVLSHRGQPTVTAPAVELSWPLPADGYGLEAADDLSGPWTPISTLPSDRPGQRRAVSLEQKGDRRYFRLHKP